MEKSDIISLLEGLGISYKQNEPMAEYTTFKIGGPADFLCEPDALDKLRELLAFCRKNEVPYFILGNGSNILVSDEGIEGLVISLKEFNDISLPNAFEIKCDAGVKLSRLCNFALESELSGLEFAWGIPGTVGGAIYMNAGAYNSEISSVLTECTYIDESGNIVQADASALGFGYRKSIFTDSKKVILSAVFRLRCERTETIRSQMDELIARRRQKQPIEYPSAGSTFKRPQGNFAGSLIEKSGLKGLSVGGAEVSEKHAGFIINKGGATCRDVRSLISKVKEDVFLKESVVLEPEVKFIGR